MIQAGPVYLLDVHAEGYILNKKDSEIPHSGTGQGNAIQSKYLVRHYVSKKQPKGH